MEKEKFDQKEYTKSYNKKNYRHYNIYVRREKADMFDELCKKNKLVIAELFNNLIDNILEEDNTKK